MRLSGGGTIHIKWTSADLHCRILVDISGTLSVGSVQILVHLNLMPVILRLMVSVARYVLSGREEVILVRNLNLLGRLL